jgi:hypothetical protein
MAKYATFDGTGRATGFFDTWAGAIPSGAVPITKAQFAALIAAPATATLVDGALGTYSGGAFTPSLAQQAKLAIAAGLAITSTGSASALDGTYALDTTTIGLAADLAALIAANGGAFPRGASTWSWPDASGALHVFTAASTFVAFYHALAAYRLALFAVMWGTGTSLPAATATIP